MAKAVVLLFLLDSLPGSLRTCDSTVTAPVLQVIGKKLNLTQESLENLQHIDFPTGYMSHKYQELSPETLNGFGFNDNSIRESNEFSMENSHNFVGHVYTENATKNKDVLEAIAYSKFMPGNASTAIIPTGINSELVKQYFLNASRNEDLPDGLKSNGTDGYPENAPFLVAIFETVGNVTAQTCGGVVVSPHWVLTAVSCVNVLGDFYSNSSNEATENYYSVVADATDPLKDGTVHQVSSIYVHPSTSPNVELKHINFVVDAGLTASSLALLRVEPVMTGEAIGLMDGRTWDGDARIYGWALHQNKTSFEMTSASLPAKGQSSADCKQNYSIVQNDTMCLSVLETATNNTKMHSGCPVVAMQDGRPRLLAVALADGTTPLLASPISSHLDWLTELTTENVTKSQK